MISPGCRPPGMGPVYGITCRADMETSESLVSSFECGQTGVDRCVGRCADSARNCMRADSRACSHQRADGDDDNNNPLTGFRTVCLALATDIGPLVSDCGLQLCEKTAVCAMRAKRERAGALLRYTGMEAVGIFSPSAINSSRMRKILPCDRHPINNNTDEAHPRDRESVT